MCIRTNSLVMRLKQMKITYNKKTLVKSKENESRSVPGTLEERSFLDSYRKEVPETNLRGMETKQASKLYGQEAI